LSWVSIDEAEVGLKGVLSLDVNLAGHEELRILGAGLLAVAGSARGVAKMQSKRTAQRTLQRTVGWLHASFQDSTVPNMETPLRQFPGTNKRESKTKGLRRIYGTEKSAEK